jgi:hypothetical protein
MPINFAIKLVATVALEAASIGLQAMKRTYGPRLSETQVTTADYGTPLPRFLGARRMAGQIVWSKDLDIVNETHKIKGGGKQTTQSALWTAGVAFADCRGGIGPIDKILKIWLDETLAYDATGTGPVSYASSLHIDLASVMRIYTGAEDQGADPAYVEYCDDRYGPDSAPAFRGTAMLVFDRMPLDNFGNRPPQISVLAVSSSTASFPVEFVAAAHPVIAPALSPDGSRLYAVAGTGFEVFDIPTRTRLLSTNPGFSASWPGAAAPDAYYSSGSGEVWEIDPNSGVGTFLGPDTDQDGRGYGGGCTYAGGFVWCYPSSGTNLRSGYWNGTNITGTDIGFYPSLYFEDVDGAAVAVGANSSGVGFYIGAADGAGTLVDTTAHGSTSGTAYAYDSGDAYVVRQADTLFLVDKLTYAITADAAVDPAGNLYDSWVNIVPGSPTFWNGAREYSATDLSLLRTIDTSDWNLGSVDGGANMLSQLLWEPVNQALLSFSTAVPQAGIGLRYVNRASNAGVTLGTIISKMCDAAALSARDTSALTQIVQGYSWTRGDVKSQMEPLLDIHDVDARPHDFEIEFKIRGSAPSGTILTADFAKNGDGPRYKMTKKQDTDLPKLIRVNFADTMFDQEENNVLSPLTLDEVDTERDATIDLTTYAAAPDEAQQLSDRYMRRQWNSRDGLENSLTAQQLAVEPGDVKTLDLDGIAWNARLEKQTVAGSRIDCTWVRDETSFAAKSSATGPDMGGRDGDVIVIPAPVTGFVLDVPLREDGDADIRPLLYSGAGAYASLAFPSATIWEETGSGASAAYDQLFATVSGGATWGLATSTLANANPNLWDRGNTLTVSLQSGILTNVSEADIDADPTLNLILVGSQANGWEYLNFTTAALVSGSTYTLSGFKRGRRGTEWMVGAHGAGEAFVLASALDIEEMGSDDVGDSLSFKAQSLGRSLDAAPAINVAPFTGASLKPYAPARINWTTDGTDMFGEIIRRTRVGGSWTDSGVVPLSENSEAYEVDIYHGATFKRTIAVTGTNTFTYTGTEISADGNSVGVAPSVNVYQMSDAVGRGFALAA